MLAYGRFGCGHVQRNELSLEGPDETDAQSGFVTISHTWAKRATH